MMGIERKTYSQDILPFKLDEECWGKINEATEKCPDVYGVCTDPTDRKYTPVTYSFQQSVAHPPLMSCCGIPTIKG